MSVLDAGQMRERFFFLKRIELRFLVYPARSTVPMPTALPRLLGMSEFCWQYNTVCELRKGHLKFSCYYFEWKNVHTTNEVIMKYEQVKWIITHKEWLLSVLVKVLTLESSQMSSQRRNPQRGLSFWERADRQAVLRAAGVTIYDYRTLVG